MMSVYFDNDVCSTVSRRDRAPRILPPWTGFLNWADRRPSRLRHLDTLPGRWSERPTDHQPQLKNGLREMTLTPDDHRVLGSHMLTDPYWGCICSPLVTDIVDEPLMSNLIAAGLEIDDAKHVMYASGAAGELSAGLWILG
jgi:hypothetical protein